MFQCSYYFSVKCAHDESLAHITNNDYPETVNGSTECLLAIKHTTGSSVDCGERVYGYFRFALRCPDGAISGQKRVF